MYYSGNFFLFKNGFFLGPTSGSFTGSTFRPASSAFNANQGLNLDRKYISFLQLENMNEQGGVSHFGLAVYIKTYLKAKELELSKFKYFTMQK